MKKLLFSLLVLVSSCSDLPNQSEPADVKQSTSQLEVESLGSFNAEDGNIIQLYSVHIAGIAGYYIVAQDLYPGSGHPTPISITR